MKLTAILCFFFSGLAGLVYEICWIRKASLIFGSTTFALSTILAVFFTGLAIGSYIFGRLAKKQSNPLRWYAFIELLLAIFALASLYLFDSVSHLYANFFYNAEASTLVSIASRILLVSLVLLPPTILMGATLPLLCRFLIADDKKIANKIGLLYGINTLGAVAGCAITGFWLLPTIGVTKSVLLAVLINVVIAVITGLLSQTKTHSFLVDSLPSQKPRPKQKKFDYPVYSVNSLAIMFFMTGFVAIGSEVLWSRFLTLILRNTVHTYTITLSVVLTGIVIGSLLASRLFDKQLKLMTIFAYLQIITALLNLILMLLPAEFWRELGQGILPILLLMLIPAIFSGICFPLINRLAISDFTQSSDSVGRMSAINIFGGVLGSLSIGFIFLPHFGLKISLQLITGIALATGIMAILLKDIQFKKSFFPSTRLALPILAIIVWITIPIATSTQLPHDYLDDEKLLIDVKEGYGSTLSVSHKGTSKLLKIDRLWQGTDVKNHQSMVAHIPMILHPSPKDILVIGIGVGQTASRFLYYDTNLLDVVDIEPAIFSFIRKNFDSQWMNDPRVTLLPEDGRTYIDHGKKKYDIISIEVGQVFRPGVEAFYSLEFYQNASHRLNEKGLISQFVPLAFFKPEQFKSILATFRLVFPNCILWYNTQEMLLIGSKNDQVNIDPDRLQLITKNKTLSADMAFSYWGDVNHHLNIPEVFLAGYISGPEEITSLTTNAPHYTDDLPTLAYAVSNAYATDHNEIVLSQLLSNHLSPINQIFKNTLSFEQLEKISVFRRENLNDLITNAHLAGILGVEHTANLEELIKLIQKALKLNPGNAMANRIAGNIFSRNTQPRLAARYYRKAVSINPEDAIAHRGLALAHGQLGNLDQSLAQARIALSLKPDDSAALNILGLALIGKGRPLDAIVYLEKSLKLNPENANAKEYLSLARQRAKI